MVGFLFLALVLAHRTAFFFLSPGEWLLALSFELLFLGVTWSEYPLSCVTGVAHIIPRVLSSSAPFPFVPTHIASGLHLIA